MKLTNYDLRLLEPLPFKYDAVEARKMMLPSADHVDFINALAEEYNEYFNATSRRGDVYAHEQDRAIVKIEETQVRIHVTNNGGKTDPWPGVGMMFEEFDCIHQPGNLKSLTCVDCGHSDGMISYITLTKQYKQGMLHFNSFHARGDADPLLRAMSRYRVTTRIPIKLFYGQFTIASVGFWPELWGDMVHVYTVLTTPDAEILDHENTFPIYVNSYKRDQITAKVLRRDIVDAAIAAEEVVPLTWMCTGCYTASSHVQYGSDEKFSLMTRQLCESCISESIRTGVTPSGAVPNVEDS